MRDARFETAVAEHSGKVHTFATYLLGNAAEAEDVTQEVLIRLWTRITEIDPQRVRPWLLRVTRNACIDQIRRRRRSAEVIPIRHPDAPPPDRPSPEPSPEQIAAGGQLGGAIAEALTRLSDNARGVVILREVQGLSYAEISEVMDLSVGSVRVMLHRGRRRLRELLKEVDPNVAAS